VLVVAGALIGAGCGGNVQSLSFPNPPSTAPSSGTTVATLPPDLSAVAQPPVAGVTTTTAPRIGPGQAALNGTVFGPSGPVPGATVQADRVVGNLVTSARTTTAADGSWTIGNILGGRYRVRAWQSPSLAVAAPQIVFLDSTQTLSMSLQVAQYQGSNVAVVFSPPNPMLGEPVNMLVQVTTPTVGPDGAVRNPPDAGADVTLTDGPAWQADNGNPLTTDPDGEVVFQLTCTTAGAAPLSAAVGAAAATPLVTPLCSAPPTTTTTSPCPGVGTPTTFFSEPSTTSTTLVFGLSPC
jgi:hypothetical protein